MSRINDITGKDFTQQGMYIYTLSTVIRKYSLRKVKKNSSHSGTLRLSNRN